MSYFKTYSGKEIDIDTLCEDDICLKDIAHGLVTYKRFGASLEFSQTYNVAEHSMLMAEYVLDLTNKESAARLALFHDSAEAYLGDMPTPIKVYLPDYIKLEAKFKKIIFSKYSISTKYKDLVDNVDKSIMLDEALSLRPKYYNRYKVSVDMSLEPLGLAVKGNNTQIRSERIFLDWCDYLGIKD